MSRDQVSTRMTTGAILLALLFTGGICVRVESQEISWAEVARRGRAATVLVTLLGPSGQRMVGEASAFCVHPSGLFVTNHHAIRSILPPEITAAVGERSAIRGRIQPTSPAPYSIPIAVPAEGKPRINLILNSSRPDQTTLLARVLWTDPDYDLALLRTEGKSDLPALSIALESDLARLGDVVAFGFPLGQALAMEKSFPAVNVTRGKVLKVTANDGKPREIEAELSISPGNSGGPLLDKSGHVVGVIYARLEHRPTGNGISLAIPVNRLEWFLSRPEIAVTPRLIARAGAANPVEFQAELKTLFPPRDPVEIELTLGNASRPERSFPMRRAEASYRATAVPFPAAKVKPSVRLTLINNPDPLTGRVNQVLTHGDRPGSRITFGLADVRRIRLRPALELEGTFTTRLGGPKKVGLIAGPVAGIDQVLAELERQLPNFDPEEVDEIEVEKVNSECLLTVWRVGTMVGVVECDDRVLKVGAQTVPLSSARCLRLGKLPQVELAHNERLEGPIAGLDGLLAEIKRRMPKVDAKVITKILVDAHEAPDTDHDTVRCTLVARRAGTIVGRLQTEIYAQDPEPPSLETLSQGKFIRPRRSLSPVTSLRLRIPEGDRFGQCDRKDLVDEFRRCLIGNPAGAVGGKQTLKIEGEKLLATRFGPDDRRDIDASTLGITVCHLYSSWRVGFALPLGRTFETGEYVINAEDGPRPSLNPRATGYAAGLVTGLHDVKNRVQYEGRLRVWELKGGVRGQPVDRLAIDFVLRYKTTGAKPGAGGENLVVGMYRWRSTFE